MTRTSHSIASPTRHPSTATIRAAILARTAGDRLADGLAGQMTPKQRRRFACALTTVKTIGDDPPDHFFTVRDPDGVVGLFVDADPYRGWSGATYPVERLRARVAARQTVPCIAMAAAEVADRLAHDLVAGRLDGAVPRRALEVRHADDLALAALLVTSKHLARISDVLASGQVPVLAIVGSTRATFASRPTFFVSVGSLPNRTGAVRA